MSTETISATETTISTTAADLAIVLGATTPFAAEVGYGIPSLEAVQLSAGDGVLAAVATNRYVVGYARKSAQVDRPVRFLLEVSHARAIRKMLSAALKEREHDFEVALVFSDEADKRTIRVQFEPYYMSFSECTGTNSAPDLGKIIADQVQPGATPAPGPVGFNASALMPFIKAAKWAENQPLRWSFGDHMKPARVEIDDWFVGLVMPVRLPERQKPVECVMPAPQPVDGAA